MEKAITALVMIAVGIMIFCYGKELIMKGKRMLGA